jgi:hypothetical protein
MNQAVIRPIAPGQRPARSPAGAAAAAGFIGLAGFELALALGAPLGRAAMGGTHTYLPAGLRIVAGFATLLWPLAALVVLHRGGYRAPLISLLRARPARTNRAPAWRRRSQAQPEGEARPRRPLASLASPPWRARQLHVG